MAEGSALDQVALGLADLTQLTPQELACSANVWIRMYGELRVNSSRIQEILIQVKQQ